MNIFYFFYSCRSFSQSGAKLPICIE